LPKEQLIICSFDLLYYCPFLKAKLFTNEIINIKIRKIIHDSKETFMAFWAIILMNRSKIPIKASTKKL